MLKVAIDFHNVLADLDSMWRGMAKERYGLDIDVESVTEWKTWACTPIKKEQFWELIDDINKNHLTPEIPMIRGAFENFPELFYSYPVEILTAVPHETVPDIREWLVRNKLPKAKVNSLGISKAHGELKLERDFQIYVDDNPYICQDIPEGKYVILFDAPWNRHVKPNNKNIWRAYGWNDVKQIVHILQKVY